VYPLGVHLSLLPTYSFHWITREEALKATVNAEYHFFAVFEEIIKRLNIIHEGVLIYSAFQYTPDEYSRNTWLPSCEKAKTQQEDYQNIFS